MSSKLAKKKKKKPNNRDSFESHVDKSANMLLNVSNDMKENMAYTLFVNFDFGEKMVRKWEGLHLYYDVEAGKNENLEKELRYYIDKKIGIDVGSLVKRVPQDYKMKMAKMYYPECIGRPKQFRILEMVNRSLELFFTFCLVALRDEHITNGNRYYWNTIPKIKEMMDTLLDVTMKELRTIATQEDIRVSLKTGINYEVRRFNIETS